MTNLTAPNTRPRFKKPVAWLLGRDLIASLQGTLLYTAFGSKLDPREWMRAEPIRFADEEREGVFWFDYISDSGDGMKATYSIAYLSLSNLYVEDLSTEMPSGEARVNQKRDNKFKEELPRGKFLLVGGDTSYHLSDYATLGSRFYQPFKWAFEDLWKRLQAEGRTDESENLTRRRPIFGIPGNHDYYDQLDGFRRQFLHPIKPENDGDYQKNMPDDADTTVPQLMLPGFKRLQNASYVALQLPFGWWFWGLDTEVGLIDEHQQNFFQDIKRKLHKEAVEDWEEMPEESRGLKPDLKDFPRKLVIATCSPTTSFGRFARGDDEKSAGSFHQLGLSQPFLPKDISGTLSERSGDELLENGQCRLDLSGDYHFYARYWGPPSNQTKPRESDTERPSADSYASVISGLGGAFHHPSQTFFGDLQEQVLYPQEKKSRKEFSKPLFDFWSVFRGGGIGVIGFCLAFTIYFTATIPESSRPIVQNVLSLPPSKFAVASPVPIEPTVLQIKKENETSGSDPENSSQKNGGYYIGPNRIDPPLKYWLSIGFLLASLALIVAGAILFPKPGKRQMENKEEGEKKIVVEEDPTTKPEQPSSPKGKIPTGYEQFQKFVGSITQFKFGVLVLLSAAALFAGLIIISPLRRENITPFGQSMLVLATLVWSAAAVFLSFLYSEWLFKQAEAREIKARDWALPLICSGLSVISVFAGLWLFGKYNVPAYLATDIILVISTLGLGIVIVLLAVFVGGADLKGKAVWGMVVIGVWHAVTQLTIPFLLVRKGNSITFIAALLLIVLFGLLGWQLMKRNQCISLLVSWFLFGILMIGLPHISYLTFGNEKDFVSYHGVIGNLQTLWREKLHPDSFTQKLLSSFVTTAPSLIAGVIGMVMSCIWLGWYLAVCLSFNAHNNEAGGAGRVEKFKEFIRFRVTENEITGYVIAVDEPQKDGSLLKPRLIDVFSLKVKGSP